MKFLISIILVSAAGALFILFTDPAYQEIKELRSQAAVYNDALANSAELQKVRDAVLSEYNTIAPSDRELLAKLLPDTVDNVRLVRDIDGIASRHGMTLRDVQVEVGDSSATTVGGAGPPYNSALVTFTVNAPYQALVDFFVELERSLRLVDIVSLTFVSTDDDLAEYQISIRTYWLK